MAPTVDRGVLKDKELVLRTTNYDSTGLSDGGDPRDDGLKRDRDLKWLDMSRTYR